VSSLVLGFIAKPTLAATLEPLLDGIVGEGAVSGVAVVLAISLATVFQMVVGELVPKTIAIERPYETSTRLGFATQVWGTVAKPIIASFDASANWTVRRFGLEPVEELEHIRSLDEIERLIVSSGHEGTLDDEDVTLLQKSIRLGEKTAADALIPRVEIISLDSKASGLDMVSAATSTGRSRFPVYGGGADDVVGVVHVKSIHAIDRSVWSSVSVTDLMSEPLFVPETTDLDDLLLDLRQFRNQLAIVVDEHGGTAGMITLEDILEEIVGEIQDEYDGRAPTLTRIEQRGTYLAAGSLHHEEVDEACGFSMPQGDYETLAGFVLEQLGRIPAPGDRFNYEGWRVEVVAMERRRIASVRLVRPT